MSHARVTDRRGFLWHGGLGLTATLLLAGCGSLLDKPYPARHSYLLEVDPPPAPHRPRQGPVLAVRRFDVSQAFAGRNFVIRRDDVAAEPDFYDAFVVPPAAMIRSATAQWLTKTGLFEAVIAGSSALQPNWELEARINAIYGDFRHAPRAVLEIEFRVIDVEMVPGALVHKSDLRQAAPLDAATPTALVRGWDWALASILDEFEASLQSPLANYGASKRNNGNGQRQG